MDTVSPVLEALLAKSDAALTVCQRPVSRVVYVAGAVAWDDCGCEADAGGQLWVRVVLITPQPTPSQPCDITDLLVRAEVGVIRCRHNLDEEGEDYVPPTPEEMLTDARGQAKDADILLQTIRTWNDEPGTWSKFVNWKSLRIESGSPLGPEGGCGGWAWTLSFRLLMCRGC
jgi:hypothetical protein